MGQQPEIFPSFKTRVPFFKKKYGYWLFLTEHLGPELNA